MNSQKPKAFEEIDYPFRTLPLLRIDCIIENSKDTQ